MMTGFNITSCEGISPRGARGAAISQSAILFFVAALPIELYVGPAFIRPTYALGALSLLLVAMKGRWQIDRNAIWYFLLSGLLCAYSIVNGFVNASMAASVMNVFEVATTTGFFWFCWLSLKSDGLQVFLRTGSRIFFLFAVGHMLVEFSQGDFFSFKDAYWLVLFSTILATVDHTYSKSRSSYYILIASALILLLSGSRTAWITYALFIVVQYGIGRAAFFASVPAVGVLYTVSQYNPQTAYYIDTVEIIYRSLMDYSLRDLDAWLGVADQFSNPSDTFRLLEILRAIIMIADHPWIGIGIDQYMDYANNKLVGVDGQRVLGSHNEILRVLAEGGVLMFLIMAAYYAFAIKSARRVQDAAMRRSCYALLAGSFGMSLVSPTNFMILFLLQLSAVISASLVSRPQRSEDHGRT